jgi:HK97 family phage major capsid protein
LVSTPTPSSWVSNARSRRILTPRGGYLIETKYAAPILQLALNEMKVRQAGARVIPLESKTTQVAKLESNPVPAWRAEGAAIAESAGVFGSVTLTAKSLACYCKISLELMEDSSENFGNVLGGALATAFAVELDHASLYGLGTSNQPRGIKNTSGVAITPFVGVNGGVVNNANGNFASLSPQWLDSRVATTSPAQRSTVHARSRAWLS